MDTYIDNKRIATGISKDRAMFDGVHIRYDKESRTYSYYKYNKGERLAWQDEVTKEQLLKLFTKE